MRLGDEESQIIIIDKYKMLLNQLTSYSVSDEWIADKIKALIDLIPYCDIHVFSQVCDEWVQKEDSMPTPKQLSFKCLKFVKDIEKKESLKTPKICYEIEFKKKNGLAFLEFEEDICKLYDPIEQYSWKHNSSVLLCSFHDFMNKEQNGRDWNGYKGIFQFCKNKIMSYVDSEIFMHKYLRADMSIRLEMIESLDAEHREALRKCLSNYHKEHDLESSLASVFKHVE